MKQFLTLTLIAGTLVMCQSPAKTEATNAASETEEASPTLEVVGAFEKRPGNVAVDKDGRVFTTMHPLDPADFQLVEVISENEVVPFPSLEYQKNGGEATDEKIDTPLGIRVDKNNVLWIIDMGQNLGKTRLFGFDIATKTEVYRLDLPADVAPEGSFIQDLAIDEKNEWAYLADIANPGIVAVDLKNKTARRFADSRLEAEDIDMVIDGQVINFGGAPARVAVNPITLSDNRETIFFGAMNGTKWYSVPARLFRENAADTTLSSSIKVEGAKPISDGVATDAEGVHYFTNLPDDGIDFLKDGKLQPLIRDERIDWADNVAVGPDGVVYIVVNQLHKAPAFTGAEDLGVPPYYVYKVNR